MNEVEEVLGGIVYGNKIIPLNSPLSDLPDAGSSPLSFLLGSILFKLSEVSIEGLHCLTRSSLPLPIRRAILYIYQLPGISLLERSYSLE